MYVCHLAAKSRVHTVFTALLLLFLSFTFLVHHTTLLLPTAPTMTFSHSRSIRLHLPNCCCCCCCCHCLRAGKQNQLFSQAKLSAAAAAAAAGQWLCARVLLLLDNTQRSSGGRKAGHWVEHFSWAVCVTGQCIIKAAAAAEGESEIANVTVVGERLREKVTEERVVEESLQITASTVAVFDRAPVL